MQTLILAAAVLAQSGATDAIGRAREFLASRQSANGSFEPEGIAAELRLGMTALAALVLDGKPQQRALDYLVACQGKDGLIADRQREKSWGAWEHGYATLALGSAGREKEFRAAVRWILAAQRDDGSWSYGPRPSPNFVQTGLHCTMIECLLLAKRRGVDVDAAVFRRAAESLGRQRCADGGYRNHEFETPSPEITAAALAALGGLGDEPSLDALPKVADFVLPEPAGGEQCYCYDRGLHLYGLFWTLVAWQRSAHDDMFERLHAQAKRALLKAQRADGSWPGWFGPEYGTAMALLVLELPPRGRLVLGR